MLAKPLLIMIIIMIFDFARLELSEGCGKGFCIMVRFSDKVLEYRENSIIGQF